MIHIEENGRTGSSGKFTVTAEYFDHQPGDATRYEILAVALGRGIHLGTLGYIAKDAVVVVCGMHPGRAALFDRGQTLGEWYVAEQFGLTNPHTIHHVTELVAAAIGGTVAGCEHTAEAIA